MAIWIPIIAGIALIIEACSNSDQESQDVVGPRDQTSVPNVPVKKYDPVTVPPKPEQKLVKYVTETVKDYFVALADGGYGVTNNSIVAINNKGGTQPVAKLVDAADDQYSRSYLGSTVVPASGKATAGFATWYTSSLGFNKRGDQHGFVLSDQNGHFHDVNLFEHQITGPGAGMVHGGKLYLTFTNANPPRSDAMVCFEKDSTLAVVDLSTGDVTASPTYNLHNLPGVKNANAVALRCDDDGGCELLIAGAGDIYCAEADGYSAAGKVIAVDLKMLQEEGVVTAQAEWQPIAGVGAMGGHGSGHRAVFTGIGGFELPPQIHVLNGDDLVQVGISPPLTIALSGFIPRGVMHGADVLVNVTDAIGGGEVHQLGFAGNYKQIKNDKILGSEWGFPLGIVPRGDGTYVSVAGDKVTVWGPAQ